MSHSRKNSVDQNLFLLQKDLKSNYTHGQLKILAEHYEISTRLNKERLTMEIAKANLKSSKKKARMPPSNSDWPFESPQQALELFGSPSIPSHSLTESQRKRAAQEALAMSSSASSSGPMMELTSFHGTEGNVHLNKHVLQQARQDCMNHVEQLQRTTQETLATIGSGRDKMYDDLENQLQLDPQEFEDIISKVNLVCSNELNDIENCITSALTKSVVSAKAFIASVPEVGTDELLQAAQELADSLESLKVGLRVTPTVPGLSSPDGLGMQSAPVPVQAPFAISTPPSAPAVLSGQEPRVLFPHVEETITATPTEDEGISITSTEEEGISITPTPERPLVYPSSPTAPPPSREVESHSPDEEEVSTFICESDQDCEEAQREGRLSGLHEAQSVICVTKRDGTPDCAYQA